MSATYEDRYGLPLSAQGREAAEHYIEGIDCALALSVGAQASLEAAIAADADFAMAHIALVRSSSTGATSPQRKRVNYRPSSVWRA